MTDTPAFYLFDPDGVASGGLTEELAALGSVQHLAELPAPAAVDEAGEEPGTIPRPPGWIFIPEGTSDDRIVGLLQTIAEGTDEWSPLLVRWASEPGSATVVPLSAGFAEPANRTVERLRTGGMETALLSFRVTLREIARIRHDLNNPLTAAMAEVQLLLMDTDPDSEVGASLKVVEEQLRRLRDLVAELTPLRIPRG